MKKSIFNVLTLSVLAVCLIFTLGSCKKKEETSNPMTESSYKEVIKVTGIDLPAPSDAENVEYYYYKADGEEPLAEMRFMLGSNEYTMRAQSTTLTSIAIDEADLTSITADKLKEKYGDISGMNYEWATFATTEIQGRSGYVATSKDGAGIIIWLDAAPGIIYSLSMDSQANQQLLIDTATAAFVPMQGEVG